MYFIIPDEWYDDGDHDDDHDHNDDNNHDDDNNQDGDDDHDHDDEDNHDDHDHDEDEYGFVILFVFLGGVVIFIICTCIYMVLLVAIGLVLHIKMIQKQECSK